VATSQRLKLLDKFLIGGGVLHHEPWRAFDREYVRPPASRDALDEPVRVPLELGQGVDIVRLNHGSLVESITGAALVMLRQL
jgi:hypothetical protein